MSVTCFQFKGGMVPLTALQILDPSLQGLTSQLLGKIQQAPQFFKKVPIIVDLQRIKDSNNPLDFKSLLNTLNELQIIPIGIRGGSEEHLLQAQAAGLATFPEQKHERDSAVEETPQNLHTARLLTQPVRSGQQVFSEGDLVVHAAVSSGAEILAVGHIHVYGPLRGRALAGMQGEQNARIYCQSLEAELVSICGHYLVHEDLCQHPLWKHAVVIMLKDERIVIEKL